MPLAHLPEPTTAHAVLSKLAADPAIQHVMQTHRFAVNVLTELAPHEQPHLLGLNVNRGEAIKLRIRTDAYDGFRNYSDVRRVLCHELAHNVWGDHDDNVSSQSLLLCNTPAPQLNLQMWIFLQFKSLNSLLNKEVTEFERAARAGAHTLAGPSAAIYSPPSPTDDPSDIDVVAHEYVLGSVGSRQGQPLPDTLEGRRQRALEAAVRRLQLEEAEVENSCGTAGPQAATTSSEDNETPAAGGHAESASAGSAT